MTLTRLTAVVLTQSFIHTCQPLSQATLEAEHWSAPPSALAQTLHPYAALTLTQTLKQQTVQRQLSELDQRQPVFTIDAPAQGLKSFPGLLVWPRQRQGKALFALESPEHLTSLAQFAHSARDGLGPGCGRIRKWLPLTQQAQLEEQPSTPMYPEFWPLARVSSLIEQVDQQRLLASIASLEALGSRFHLTDSGLQTPARVKELFEQQDPSNRLDADISESPNNADLSNQANVIARIPGQREPETTIIIGAHLDSINARGSFLPAPGADDDASGIAVLVEAFRIFAGQGTRFARSVEFQAYGAEEVGLIGSQTLARAYRRSGKKVGAMLQVDMTGYSSEPGKDTIFLIADYPTNRTTNANLRRSASMLLNSYLGGDYQTKALRAGTSDHDSWVQQGYPAIFPFQDPDNFNPLLHTSQDRSENLTNPALIRRFAQLVVAFVAHHAGDLAAEEDYRQVQATVDRIDQDLQLALLAHSNAAEGFDLFVSTQADTVTSVEVCPSISSTLQSCGTPFVVLEDLGLRGDRRMFGMPTAAPASVWVQGQSYLLRAYDDQDRLVSQRVVERANTN